MNKSKRNMRGRHLQPPTRAAGLAQVASVPIPQGEFWASWEAERQDRVAQLEASSREPLMAQDLSALAEIDIALRDEDSSIFEARLILVDLRTGAKHRKCLPVAALLLEKRDVLSWLVALALASGPWQMVDAFESALHLLDSRRAKPAPVANAEEFLRQAIRRYETSGELTPLMQTLARGRATSAPGLEFVRQAAAEVAAETERAALEAEIGNRRGPGQRQRGAPRPSLGF